MAASLASSLKKKRAIAVIRSKALQLGTPLRFRRSESLSA
jgi:hypothetical protein